MTEQKPISWMRVTVIALAIFLAWLALGLVGGDPTGSTSDFSARTPASYEPIDTTADRNCG